MTVDSVRERYARFARDEAPGRSDVYEAWALEAATGPAAEVIATFPEQRRQPPLVFAVTRQLGCGLVSGPEWGAFVAEHADELREEIARRSLQTNEPLRCAALLPALSLIDGPIALIELGAAGGLCLYPDRFGYHYDGAADVHLPGTPVLRSELLGTTAPVLRHPQIVWRAGVDLNPLDVTDPDDAAWLRRLVWPGEEGREERIAQAIAVAAAEPPRMFAGGAAELLDDVLAEVPAGLTVVVTTPGVLPYLPWQQRNELVARLRESDLRWITLDAPNLHDGWITDAPLPEDGFVLALDGHVLGSADPLGAWVRWDSNSADVGSHA